MICRLHLCFLRMFSNYAKFSDIKHHASKHLLNVMRLMNAKLIMNLDMNS